MIHPQYNTHRGAHLLVLLALCLGVLHALLLLLGGVLHALLLLLGGVLLGHPCRPELGHELPHLHSQVVELLLGHQALGGGLQCRGGGGRLCEGSNTPRVQLGSQSNMTPSVQTVKATSPTAAEERLGAEALRPEVPRWERRVPGGLTFLIL